MSSRSERSCFGQAEGSGPCVTVVLLVSGLIVRAGPTVLLFSCGGMSYTQLRSAPDAPDTLNAREKTGNEPHRGVIASLNFYVAFLNQMFSWATVCKDIVNRLLVWYARFVEVIDV